MTAAEKILQKALVASDIPSSEWSKIQAGLRDRAFFSSKVTEAKFLYAARQGASKFAAGEISASEFRRDMRGVLASVGYKPDEGREGTLQDLTSKRRLDLILKTNADQAKGYISHLRATTGGAYLAFPAYELIRVEERNLKRDWSAKWREAASRVNFEGVARSSSRFVAFKTSPIWKAISRFGNPFPPFDFNSGMGLRDVSKTECIELGLLAEKEAPPTPKTPGFNDHLESTVPMKDSDPEASQLKEIFGDQIRFDGNVAKWQGELIQEVISGKKNKVSLGVGFNGEKTSLSLAFFKEHLSKHVGENETHGNSIPLSNADYDLLPSIWRKPDRVIDQQGRKLLELDAFDGSTMRLVWDPVKGIRSFYKTKAAGSRLDGTKR